uniref:Uncharacterized protein n=1 Tax=Meloidogyne incognita TaxID=6306 RepID=A0A914MUS2_MELIC
MAEEGLSNSDLESKLNQSNYLIKLQNNFIELQTKFLEEKEKNFNLEKKILENELKEMREKNQKLESDLKLEKLNNVNCKLVKLVEIKNKWKYISDDYKCCKNKCINTNNQTGNCIEGNGFVNLISDEYIRYYNCVEGKGEDIEAIVRAENSFKKPQNCFNYSLFYFEVKCKMERELNNYLNWMVIGVVNNTNKCFKFIAKKCAIKNEKDEEFKISKFSWNDNDVFGCGLVYPPINKITDEFPYIFFTQNGKLMDVVL